MLLSSHRQLIYTLPEMWYPKLGTVLQMKSYKCQLVQKYQPILQKQSGWQRAFAFSSHTAWHWWHAQLSLQTPLLLLKYAFLLCSLCIWLILTKSVYVCSKTYPVFQILSLTCQNYLNRNPRLYAYSPSADGFICKFNKDIHISSSKFLWKHCTSTISSTYHGRIPFKSSLLFNKKLLLFIN